MFVLIDFLGSVGLDGFRILWSGLVNFNFGVLSKILMFVFVIEFLALLIYVMF